MRVRKVLQWEKGEGIVAIREIVQIRPTGEVRVCYRERRANVPAHLALGQ